MKRFRTKDYRISIIEDPLPHDHRIDRPYYDCMLELREDGLVPIRNEFPDFRKPDFETDVDRSDGNIYSCIRVCNEWEKEIVREVGLILPYYVHVEKCVLPTGNNLFMMLDDVLCLLDLDTMEVIKQVPLDRYVVMEVAYPYREDFILFGDGDVFRVSKELSIRWHLRRQALFVSKEPFSESWFEMKSDRICLTDEYSGDRYEVGYAGEVLKIEESEFTLAQKKENPERENSFFRIERY